MTSRIQAALSGNILLDELSPSELSMLATELINLQLRGLSPVMLGIQLKGTKEVLLEAKIRRDKLISNGAQKQQLGAQSASLANQQQQAAIENMVEDNWSGDLRYKSAAEERYEQSELSPNAEQQQKDQDDTGSRQLKVDLEWLSAPPDFLSAKTKSYSTEMQGDVRFAEEVVDNTSDQSLLEGAESLQSGDNAAIDQDSLNTVDHLVEEDVHLDANSIVFQSDLDPEDQDNTDTLGGWGQDQADSWNDGTDVDEETSPKAEEEQMEQEDDLEAAEDVDWGGDNQEDQDGVDKDGNSTELELDGWSDGKGDVEWGNEVENDQNLDNEESMSNSGWGAEEMGQIESQPSMDDQKDSQKDFPIEDQKDIANHDQVTGNSSQARSNSFYPSTAGAFASSLVNGGYSNKPKKVHKSDSSQAPKFRFKSQDSQSKPNDNFHISTGNAASNSGVSSGQSSASIKFKPSADYRVAEEEDDLDVALDDDIGWGDDDNGEAEDIPLEADGWGGSELEDQISDTQSRHVPQDNNASSFSDQRVDSYAQRHQSGMALNSAPLVNNTDQEYLRGRSSSVKRLNQYPPGFGRQNDQPQQLHSHHQQHIHTSQIGYQNNNNNDNNGTMRSNSVVSSIATRATVTMNAPSAEDATCVRIIPVTPQVKSAHLYKLFARYGEILFVNIEDTVINGRTVLSGVVEFFDAASANKALESMSNGVLFGKFVTLQLE
ncbi:hypothetical protein MIR68_009274 [Amoeboaphelidium protococcarum]|nr:hypothetical protein MIR68_009274 [Amoeboaphelidium protococcarum]